MQSNLEVLVSDQLTADRASKPVLLTPDSLPGIGIQALWTGTPTGTLKVQASMDPTDAAAWFDIPSSSVSLTGAAGTHIWTYANVFYRYVRVAYVFSSGTGSLTLNVNQ